MKFEDKSNQDSMPRLRVGKNRDGERIQALVFGVLTDYGLRADPEHTDRDLEDIEETYSNAGGVFYVLEDKKGEIVGTLGLCRIDERTCELRKMYLAKGYRRQGLGKMLMEKALAEAKQLGYQKMILETASVLTEAILLYRSYGFRPFESEQLSCRCDQAYYLAL
jgi:putative acetyltransferase